MWALTMTAKLQFKSHHHGFCYSLCGCCGKLFVAVIRALFFVEKIEDISGICSWSELPRIQQQAQQLFPQVMYTLRDSGRSPSFEGNAVTGLNSQGADTVYWVCECIHGFTERISFLRFFCMMLFFLKVNWICWPQKYFFFSIQEKKNHISHTSSKEQKWTNSKRHTNIF